MFFDDFKSLFETIIACRKHIKNAIGLKAIKNR